MGIEAQSEYFVTQSESVDGKNLSVFHAPLGSDLVIPKEVVRLRNVSPLLHAKLHGLRAGTFVPENFDVPTTIEPSSLERVGRRLGRFLRDGPTPTAIFVSREAPSEVRTTVRGVEAALAAEASNRLVDFLGPDIQIAPPDINPGIGQYL